MTFTDEQIQNYYDTIKDGPNPAGQLYDAAQYYGVSDAQLASAMNLNITDINKWVQENKTTTVTPVPETPVTPVTEEIEPIVTEDTEELIPVTTDDSRFIDTTDTTGYDVNTLLDFIDTSTKEAETSIKGYSESTLEKIDELAYTPEQTESYEDVFYRFTEDPDSEMMKRADYLAGSVLGGMGKYMPDASADLALRAMLDKGQELAVYEISAQQFNVGEVNDALSEVFQAKTNVLQTTFTELSSVAREKLKAGNTAAAQTLMDIFVWKTTEAEIQGRLDVAGIQASATVAAAQIGATAKVEAAQISATNAIDVAELQNEYQDERDLADAIFQSDASMKDQINAINASNLEPDTKEAAVLNAQLDHETTVDTMALIIIDEPDYYSTNLSSSRMISEAATTAPVDDSTLDDNLVLNEDTGRYDVDTSATEGSTDVNVDSKITGDAASSISDAVSIINQYDEALKGSGEDRAIYKYSSQVDNINKYVNDISGHLTPELVENIFLWYEDRGGSTGSFENTYANVRSVGKMLEHYANTDPEYWGYGNVWQVHNMNFGGE